MEDSKTIEKIMETVKENLELSVSICNEYGYHGTADYLEKALVCLADAKYTKVLEESQKIEQKEIQKAIERKAKEVAEMVNPQLTVDEAIAITNELSKISEADTIESEESNGC